MTATHRLRSARLHLLALPLVRPLATAHGEISRREALVVELETASGLRAFGEATPLADFGTEDLDACRAALVSTIEAAVRDGLPADASSAASIAASRPCAAFAWSTARFDLDARLREESLARTLADAIGAAGEPDSVVRSQALVGGRAPDDVATAARHAAEAGFAAFKLKLAVSPTDRDLGRDLERVAALRDVVGAEARVRLDANEAWEHDEADRALAALARFDVDFVEQPVHRDDRDALRRLARGGSIPVAADEALLSGGWRACLDSADVDVYVVKPAALGDLADAIEVARRVRDRGGRLVWSTLIDGAIGRGVAAAFAAASGDPHEVHGLGTGSLLATDLVAGPIDVVDGSLSMPDGPGAGFVPDADVLDAAELLLEVCA